MAAMTLYANHQLKFMDLFVQKGLTWHIKDQITRHRLVNGCQESTLDQLLISNEHTIEKLELRAPLSRSNHLVMHATFILANDMQFLVCNQSLGMRQTTSVTHAGWIR